VRKLKSLALIAAGYALSVGGGLAAVAVNELFMPADVAQGSPGMVAFGDMILFVLVTGSLSLAPTWFLLKLLVEKAPRALLATELLIAAMEPMSWLAMNALAVTTPEGGPSSLPNWPQAAREPLGLLIALGAIPRMVFGPVLVVIEGGTFLLVREPIARTLLTAAMSMDLVPLGIFALNLARAARY
jgi:hypothetical protein